MCLPFPTIYEMKRKLACGAAAIEMALMLPWLILMIDGVVEFGVLMYNQSVLVSATQSAARAGIAGGSAKLSQLEVGQMAEINANARLILIAMNTSATAHVVQAAEPSFQLPLSVTLQYSYQGLFIGGFLSALQLQPTMHATVVMYNE
jgi:Flp pilus assembly protein TadG